MVVNENNNEQGTPSFVKANLLSLNRDRAATQINPKPYKMSKNLIIEDDEDLVDETDVIANAIKKPNN